MCVLHGQSALMFGLDEPCACGGPPALGSGGVVAVVLDKVGFGHGCQRDQLGRWLYVDLFGRGDCVDGDLFGQRAPGLWVEVVDVLLEGGHRWWPCLPVG
jgi:hypothetical protein